MPIISKIKRNMPVQYIDTILNSIKELEHNHRTHYRNKTVFGIDANLITNTFSSKISIKYMKFIQSIPMDIKNVIIRDFNDEIGIIIQKQTIIKIDELFEMSNLFLDDNNYKLKYFCIHLPTNNNFIKYENEIIFRNNFIEFNFMNKEMVTYPDSFFQYNIYVLNEMYDIFKKWINGCNNMINLGDDGCNIGTILSNYFDNIIVFLHCYKSLTCGNEMNLRNNTNIQITRNITKVFDFVRNFNDIVVFINPGRKGMKRNEISFLNFPISRNVKYIIYMACNIKTYIKDINENLTNYTEIDKKEIIFMPDINKTHYFFLLERN